MYNLFGTVIDKPGYKVEFVVLNEDKSPQLYELKDGETIIEDGWQIANSMNKPQWGGSEWIDTEPLPPIVTEPVEPNEMEVLEKKVAELEEEKELLNKENKLLHAQVEVLSNTTDFHEELITEMAMKVYA